MPSKPGYFYILKRALLLPIPMASVCIGTLCAIVLNNTLGNMVLLAGLSFALSYAIRMLHDTPFLRKIINESTHKSFESELTDRMFRIEELDAESRIKVKIIIKLQDDIAQHIYDSTIDPEVSGLDETVDKTKELADRSLEIAKKRRSLLQYLYHTDRSAILKRAEELEHELASQSDPLRINELQLSLDAKKNQLNDFDAIEHAARRILQQLDTIEVSFESLKARLVRMSSTDISDWTLAKEELTSELSGLNSSVNTVEESINEVISIGQI